MKRAANLATNATDGNALFINEVKHFDAEIYLQILCTSPFISPKSILHSIEVLQRDNSEYDCVVGVEKTKQYTWTEDGPMYEVQRIPNSVDLPDTIIETMGLYAITREAALLTNRRIGNKPFPLPLTPEEAIDINYDDDFVLAEKVAWARRMEAVKALETARLQLTSAILTDTMDDLNMPNQTVHGLAPQGSEYKIMGRARTLKLRPLHEGEDPKGIYGALKSYDYVGNGDVIVVENPIERRAYFGELNAHLAKKQGVSGVITTGYTRDSEEVKIIGLPVYAAGSVCSDVRGRATVESMNQAIVLGGVTCRPGDLIFADSEGVVVIPQDREDEVIPAALQRVSNERNIRGGILKDWSVEELLVTHGNF